MAGPTMRLARLGAAAMLVAALLGTVAAPAAGKIPEDTQRAAWQRICEGPAGGTLSDQPVLVCDHFGLPQWSPKTIELLERFCSKALGGLPTYRSQYPQELVGCFF